MNTREINYICGQLTLQQWTSEGQLVKAHTVHNSIALEGRRLVARLFNKDAAAGDIQRVSKIGLGSSQDPFKPDQTGLISKVGETPIAKVDQVQVTDANGTPRIALRLTGELGKDEVNHPLREAGLFTEDGVMYNRVTFDTITKSNQFKLTLVWEITF